jgi:Uma2 family endonuclease
MSKQEVVTSRDDAMQRQSRGAAAAAPDDDQRRQLLEILLTPAERRRMTYEEFLAWADEDTLAEWVDGEVVITSPASKRHQNVADFLLRVVGTYVETHNLGMVIIAPFQMKLEQGREPDLHFVAREHLDRLKETHLDGPADWVVEIVSPESAGRDRGEKFYEYERAGIPEYWLIDPQTKRVEFYQLSPEGQYQLVPPDVEGVYRSAVLPGFWLRVEWLWQPPQVLDVLRELALI